MACLAIQGMQWGDEGKGKITDYCAARADIVVRSQGGNNAGHSIVRDGKRFAVRLVPSGIFSAGVVNVIANGVVVNPEALLLELKTLEEAGIKDYKLYVSTRSTILMPYHAELDKAKEAVLGKAKIGTTGRGIGPCYTDKAARLSLRMGDLLEPGYLKERLSEILPVKNIELKAYGIKEVTPEEEFDYLMKVYDELKTRIEIIDTSSYLNKSIAAGKKILFEGAQGAMLCLDHGTFPFVTSSSPLATGIPVNAGVPCSAIGNSILGITKAYTTRVGAGPFPTEIEGEEGNKIRETGHEYGVVTKRPRRVGWLDVAELRYVIRLTGVKHIALMLIDVLSCVKEIKIGVGYTLDGKKIDYMPGCVATMDKVKPVFETMKSWKEDISGCRNYDDLPKECKAYIARIEELLGVEVVLVSVGPDEKQTLVRKEIF